MDGPRLQCTASPCLVIRTFGGTFAWQGSTSLSSVCVPRLVANATQHGFRDTNSSHTSTQQVMITTVPYPATVQKLVPPPAVARSLAEDTVISVAVVRQTRNIAARARDAREPQSVSRVCPPRFSGAFGLAPPGLVCGRAALRPSSATAKNCMSWVCLPRQSSVTVHHTAVPHSGFAVANRIKSGDQLEILVRFL